MKIARWLVVLVFLLCLCAQRPALAQSTAQSFDVSLQELGHPDALLHGPSDSISYGIVLPVTWQPVLSNTLLLDVSMNNSGATLITEFDGVPIATTVIEPGNRQIEIVLPIDLLGDPARRRHLVTVNLDVAETCQEPQHSTFQIHSARSRLHLRYHLEPATPDLSSAPFPIIQRALTPDRVRFVLPDRPSALDLRLALALSAQFGAVSRGDVLLSSSTVSELKQEDLSNNHVVLIGTPSGNPLMRSLGLPAAVITDTGSATPGYMFQLGGRPVDSRDGVVQILPSPWNAQYVLLVVSGLDDSALLRAGQAAAGDPTLPMYGQVALVQDAEVIVPTRELSSTQTFAEMGYDDQQMNGVDGVSVQYRFSLPPSWSLTSEAALRVDFAHADTSATELAVVNVRLNDRPLASIPLTQQNVSGGQVTIPLHNNQVRPGINRLVFDAVVSPIVGCINPRKVPSWVQIFNTSALTLTHTLRDTPLDLRGYPALVNATPGLRNVLVSLPAVPTAAQRDGAMALLSRLGAENTSDFFLPQVQLGGTPDANALEGNNVIVIGRPSENPLLAAANSALPQPFVPGSDEPDQTTNRVRVRLGENLNVGLIELIPSPWDATRSLLAITGTSDQAVQWSLAAMTDPNTARSLSGRLISVRGTVVESLPAGLAETRLAITPTPVVAPAPTAVVRVQTVDLERPAGPASPNPLVMGGLLIGALALLALGVWQGIRQRRAYSGGQKD
jgi:hypothetical protein